MGDVLKPGPASGIGNGHNQTGNVLATGGTAAGIGAQQLQSAASTGKVLTGDLDSSLASLAENLTINKSASAQVK